jgi:hypothetical protein
MKKVLRYAFVLAAGLMFSYYAQAQCTPDAMVTDPEGNGEMVPDTIHAYENQALNLTLTIIAPDTASYSGNVINIHHLTLRSLQNKPAWMNYACNPSNCEYNGTTAGCALITGTPPAGSAGTYAITVLVDVFVDMGGLIGVVCVTCPSYPNGYDSGMPLIVIVHEAQGMESFQNTGFGIIPATPNPFSDEVKIGCNTTRPGTVSLDVFDMTGKVVYSENLNTISGDNYFEFDGSSLSRGSYFYTLTNSDNASITRKLVKTR